MSELTEKQKELGRQLEAKNPYLKKVWVGEYLVVLNIPLYTRRYVRRHTEGLRDITVWGPHDKLWGVWEDRIKKYHTSLVSFASEDGRIIRGKTELVPNPVLAIAEELRQEYLKEREQ